MRPKKRGLSTVVTTLIIILLVLVDIGTVWAVVHKVIQGGVETTGSSFNCLEIDVTANSISGCVFGGGDYTCKVTFTRKAGGGEIAGLKVIFYDGVGENGGVIDVSGNIVPLESVSKSISGINTEAIPIKIEVFAYFKDSRGKEHVCTRKTVYQV
jgi:hypothetical protein